MTDRSQFSIFVLAAFFACFGLIAPAAAQMAPGGLGSALGPIGGGGTQHLRRQPSQNIAPPALPGASGAGNISAGPVANPGADPTKLLFEAINHGDYAQASAAVRRGADVNARNALGETPIELAVELNRNQITFMLLSVHAEEGQPGAAPATSGPGGNIVPPSPKATQSAHRAEPLLHAVKAKPQVHAAPAAPASEDPGHPDPSAGFLGFGSN